MTESVAKFVQAELRKARGPVEFAELAAHGRAHYAPDDIREAIWSLIEDGRVELTTSWKIKLTVAGKSRSKDLSSELTHGRVPKKPKIRRTQEA